VHILPAGETEFHIIFIRYFIFFLLRARQFARIAVGAVDASCDAPRVESASAEVKATRHRFADVHGRLVSHDWFSSSASFQTHSNVRNRADPRRSRRLINWQETGECRGSETGFPSARGGELQAADHHGRAAGSSFAEVVSKDLGTSFHTRFGFAQVL